jgi:hypothetical protein
MFQINPTTSSIQTRSLAALAALLEAAAHVALAIVALEKARPDDSKHPGWPAVVPDGQGGKYRPKDEEGVQVAGDVWVRAKRQRRKSGGPRDRALSEASKRAVRMPIEAGLRVASIEAPGLGLMLNIGLDLAERAYPFLKAYFDPPQTLEALQAAALDPR